MAASALRAGITTVVWNRSPAAVEDLRDLGAEVAETPIDAAQKASIVVTMLPDADVVLSVAQEQGMLAAMTPGSIWVQMSTIGVAGIERVAALAAGERPDVTLIDAPVSGSKGPAEKGQLNIFASGPDEVRPRLEPLFAALGQRTIWVGPVGAGSRLKLVANAWLALGAEAVSASLALACQFGLEMETVMSALDGNPLVSPWQAAKLPRIVQGDYSDQFGLALALKDVHLALEAASDDRFQALAGLAQAWQEMVDFGLGDLDLTVVAWALEQKGSTSRNGVAAS
jgi:3-hydroxyisobutyrate dehydrogenase